MKEKDKLKEFVDLNRSDFELHEPPSLNFDKLNQEQKNKTKTVRLVPLKKVLQIAAAITILVGISGGLYLNSISTGSENQILAKESSSEDFQLASVSSEMAETENYYIQQVNSKQKQIEELGFSEDIKEELTLLDEEFSNLKSEIGQGVDNEIIIEKMIMNYQLKLDLLEKILNSINSVKEKPTKQDKDENNYTIYY